MIASLDIYNQLLVVAKLEQLPYNNNIRCIYNYEKENDCKMATIEEIQQNPMLNLKIIHRYLTDEEISANKIEDLNDLITK